MKHLREKLANLSVQMNGILAKATAEKRANLTTEEAEQFDRVQVDYDATEADLNRSVRAAKITAVLGESQNPGVVAQFAAGAPDLSKIKDAHTRAFNAYLRAGIEGVSSEDLAVLGTKFRNTTSTTTGSQGGYLVPQDFSDLLERAQKWFGGMDATGTFTTGDGADLVWPTLNDTASMGRIIGQNVAVTQADPSFGQLLFKSYIFSSDLVLIPFALLQDSAFDLNTLVASLLGERIGRLKNKKYTIGAGSGSGEPLGIVPAAVAAGNVLVLGTGHSASLSFDDLTDLEHLVDPAYRPGSKYMFHDSTLKALKKLKDNNLRPLWTPANYAAGGNAAQPAINDHPYVINNDMAVLGANNASVLFGDLSKYKQRQVAGGTTVRRLDERFADALQVGFFAYTRVDGGLIDAGTHPVAVLENSAT